MRSAANKKTRIGACQTRLNQFSGRGGVGRVSLRADLNVAPEDGRLYTLQKFLAQYALKSQARCAMSTFARSTNHGRAFIAICVSGAFLWALALSASPQLHQRVHKDTNRVEHNCAATMIASGSYDHAAHPPLVSPRVPSAQFSKIPALTPQWVESPFLGACFFEHAPPARG
jgi:hypothetical protein